MILLSPWLAVPSVIVVVFAVCDHFFATFSLAVLAPVWILSAILSAVWCVRRVWTHGWLPGLIAFVLPIVMLLDPWGVLWAPIYVGDVIRFTAMKPSYDRKVVSGGLVEFDWGGWLFSSDGVVYDPTDEIGLPTNRRSAAWQEQERNSDLMCGTDELFGPVHPLWGHYYLANFGC